MSSTVRASRVIAAVGLTVFAGFLYIGCGGSAAPPAETGTSAPAPATPAEPPAAAVAEVRNLADLFPAGPQKEAVLNNCASCHNLACSVIGQRPAERWDSLLVSHKDNVPGADVQGMFAYLKANFDSTKPEPKVPSAFLEGGCTPF